MHADSYFRIGKTHKVCQDYALHGRAEAPPEFPDDEGFSKAFAIVSDGCSSSPDTDFGSRLIARAAVSVMPDGYNQLRCVQVAETWREAVQLPQNALDATLMALWQESPDRIEATVSGDGVLAARRTDGTYEWVVIEYLPGTDGRSAPAYLSYTLDAGRLDQYLTSAYCTRKVTRFLQPPGGEVQECESYEDRLLVSDLDEFIYDLSFETANYSFVSVLSDGAQSFQRKNDSGRYTPIPLVEVLGQVLHIKGSGKGQFITRRCNRFFTEFCPSNGWEHNDDFSMAAIWCRET